MPVRDEHVRLLEVLRRHKVQFVVVGGCAAQLHGWAGQTEDLDVTPQRVDANLKRLVEALRELDAELVESDLPEGFEMPGGIDVRLLRNMTSAAFSTVHGRLDLAMLPDGTKGYDGLARGANRVRVEGAFVLFAALRDVITSKRAAGRVKDRAVLPQLEQLERYHRGRG